MKTWVSKSLLLIGCVLAGVALMAPAAHATHEKCACLDLNDNGKCDPGEPTKDPVDGGSFPGQVYLIPSTCAVVVDSAPKGGIRIEALKIVVNGKVEMPQTNSEGILLVASGDIRVEQSEGVKPLLRSGGGNKLTDYKDRDDHAAIAKASVGLWAGGRCIINNAELYGIPYTGAGLVGMQCEGKVEIHGSTIWAAGVDIQSMADEVDASLTSGVPGIACDDPVKNLTSNGNGNGVLDGGDFACQIQFLSPTDISAFCNPPGGPNDIRALNNPLVIIAKTDLLLGAPSYKGNFVEGRFHVLLAAEDGDVDTRNANITNHPTDKGPAGGAEIWVFGDPTSIRRYPVLKEKAFGPSAGDIKIEGTCFESANPVYYGGVLVGTPNPDVACAQKPADFVAVTSGP